MMKFPSEKSMESNEIDFSKKSAEEIENIRVEKQKALIKAQDNLTAVKLEDLELKRQIDSLRAKRSEYALTLEKGQQIVSRFKTEIDILATQFWKKRHER